MFKLVKPRGAEKRLFTFGKATDRGREETPLDAPDVKAGE